MKLTKHEHSLIEVIRALEFDDLLDAVAGIEQEATQAKGNALAALNNGRLSSFNGFNKRAENLSLLAKVLGDANKDYRHHIHPEEFIDLAINPYENTVEQLEGLINHIREGWVIGRVIDNTDNDKQIYITLELPDVREGEED